MATHSSILAWTTPRTEEPGKEPGVAESDMTEPLTHTHRGTVHVLSHITLTKILSSITMMMPILQMKTLR